ncbi:MAG: SH3 domain-containing protein [Chloroflexota bacterium]|nr:SH3 domain-containing protein [Chloroflexota bacterium]
MTSDASVLTVSFCIKGSCIFSNALSGSFDPESEGVAFRSLDGGITWQEIGRGGPVFGVSGVLTDGRVLVASGDRDDGKSHYSLLPDNTPVEPPASGVYPVTVSNEILWETNDGQLLLADGTPIFTAPYPDFYVYYGSITGSFKGPQDGELLVSSMMPVPTPRPETYVDKFAVADIEVVDGRATISRQWEIDGYLAAIGWRSAKDDRAIISIIPEDATHSYSNQSPLPAILDLRSGTFNLIPGPFKSDMPGYSSLGRTIVHAVQTGPFARVTGTGSCLNIRTDPSTSGTVLTCAADGVLLRDTGQTNSDWVSVMTPGGTQGWASAAFLER